MSKMMNLLFLFYNIIIYTTRKCSKKLSFPLDSVTIKWFWHRSKHFWLMWIVNIAYKLCRTNLLDHRNVEKFNSWFLFVRQLVASRDIGKWSHLLVWTGQACDCLRPCQVLTIKAILVSKKQMLHCKKSLNISFVLDSIAIYFELLK